MVNKQTDGLKKDIEEEAKALAIDKATLKRLDNLPVLADLPVGTVIRWKVSNSGYPVGGVKCAIKTEDRFNWWNYVYTTPDNKTCQGGDGRALLSRLFRTRAKDIEVWPSTE